MADLIVIAFTMIMSLAMFIMVRMAKAQMIRSAFHFQFVMKLQTFAMQVVTRHIFDNQDATWFIKFNEQISNMTFSTRTKSFKEELEVLQEFKLLMLRFTNDNEVFIEMVKLSHEYEKVIRSRHYFYNIKKAFHALMLERTYFKKLKTRLC